MPLGLRCFYKTQSNWALFIIGVFDLSLKTFSCYSSQKSTLVDSISVCHVKLQPTMIFQITDHGLWENGPDYAPLEQI